jgi:serine/threonine protein kinase/uncharacterized tellurite resistance protein B-like protein
MDSELHFRILATVALADGTLGEGERAVLVRCSQWLGMGRSRAGTILTEVQAGQVALAAPLASDSDRLKIFRNVLNVVLADGQVTDAEAECLRRLAQSFAIPATEARRLLGEVSRSWDGVTPARSDSGRIVVQEPLEESPERDASPGPGSVIGGKFKIIERLGEGAFGAVYRARHEDLAEDVALKVLLRKAVAKKPEAEQRFLREVKLARSFVHRYAVPLREFGRDPRHGLYFAMDLVPGRTLSRVLLAEGPIAVERGVRLAAPTLEALEEAHRAGIIHRDLKPDNLMVTTGATGEEEVRVLDFGVAKAVSASAEETRLTKEGKLVGTPTYMSPEQARGEAIDARSDVYTLGVVLYEAICGSLPYALDPDSPDYLQAIFFQINAGTTPDPAAVNSAVPRPVADVLLRALKRRRDERWPDARTMRDALLEALISKEGPPRTQRLVGWVKARLLGDQTTES